MVSLLLENTDARAILIFKIQTVRLFTSGIKIVYSERKKYPNPQISGIPIPRMGDERLGEWYCLFIFLFVCMPTNKQEKGLNIIAD